MEIPIKIPIKINIYPLFGETFEAPPNGIRLECRIPNTNNQIPITNTNNKIPIYRFFKIMKLWFEPMTLDSFSRRIRIRTPKYPKPSPNDRIYRFFKIIKNHNFFKNSIFYFSILNRSLGSLGPF